MVSSATEKLTRQFQFDELDVLIFDLWFLFRKYNQSVRNAIFFFAAHIAIMGQTKIVDQMKKNIYA